MSLSSMIAKLLGKSKTPGHAPTGWGGWLDTAEGKQWEAVGEAVYDALETAKINVHARRIIMDDGAKLTLNQAAKRLADKTGSDADAIREHIMSWLEEAADSDDEERDDGLDMGNVIERWIDDARRSTKSSQ